MRSLYFTQQALDDLQAIFDYLYDEMSDLERARAIVARIETQCHKIASLRTTLGRPRNDLMAGLRSVPFQSWIIFFRYLPDSIEIAHVFHSARDIDALFNSADDAP